ncbi:MAG: hypothetical protein K2Y28_00805 [Burkholderiaceae bacterium]|nr:hypothetical protein [Burkholderiaceae bacterium]
MTMALNKRAKGVAWFGIVNGVLSVIHPVLLSIFGNQAVPPISFIFLISVGITSLAAGLYGLKGKSWAFRLLFFTFLIRTVEYFSESFFFSFIGPLSLKFGWGWNSPPSHFNLNILAIVICVLSIRAATRLKDHAGESDA